MTTAFSGRPPRGSFGKQSRRRGLATTIGLAVVLLAALLFVYAFAAHYYLDYTPKSFGDFWPRRIGLVAHIGAGTVALFVGPWQLWSGFRARYPVAHRWTGRLFLVAVAIGVLASAYLAVTTANGWAFGWGLGGLAFAWGGTTLIGYWAILNGAVALHRRWMIRAYVVTFAFVFFRLFLTVSSIVNFGSAHDRAVVASWICWSVPLAVTILVEGVQDARRVAKA